MATTERDEWEARGECSRCGSPHSYRVETVEEAVTVGENTVIVTVRSDVCSVCDQRLFDQANMEKILAARYSLEDGETAGWQAVGTVYHA